MKKIIPLLVTFVLVFSLSAEKTTAHSSGAKASDFQQQYDPNTPAIRGTFFDDFEGYEDFVLEFEPWLQLDLDLGTQSWGSSACDSFPNTGYMGAYIVFNPSQTTNGSTVMQDPPTGSPGFWPYSGDKYAACFSAMLDSLPGPIDNNDDWLITPPLDFGDDPVVSFYAKSVTAAYGLERFQVKVSVSSYDDPDDYEDVGQDYYTAGEDYIEAPASEEIWEYYEIDISDYSDETGYVAIRCISRDAFVFMVDDFQVTDVASSIDQNLVNEYTMLSNYPNPFNPTTKISFTLKNADNVRLTVYNTKGEMISTVVNGFMNIGNHSVKFDASELNAGVYYYTLETSTFKVSNKMILVK